MSGRVLATSRTKILEAFASAPAVKKPWILLSPVRHHLEAELELPGPLLLRALLPFFRDQFETEHVALGQAYVSQNIYIGRDVGGGSGGSVSSLHNSNPSPYLTSVQSLVANLFAHGELGCDFLHASRGEVREETEIALLQELATWQKLRWDDGEVDIDEILKDTAGLYVTSKEAFFSSSSSDKKDSVQKESANMISDLHKETAKKKLARRKLMQKFPLMLEEYGAPEQGEICNMLQHDRYAINQRDFHVVGENTEEKLKAYAAFMQEMSYKRLEIDHELADNPPPTDHLGIGRYRRKRGIVLKHQTECLRIQKIQILTTNLLRVQQLLVSR